MMVINKQSLKNNRKRGYYKISLFMYGFIALMALVLILMVYKGASLQEIKSTGILFVILAILAIILINLIKKF